MPRRLAAALFVIAGLSAVMGFAPSASATNTAQIRFVDRFDNGRVEASADQASAKLHNDAFLAKAPADVVDKIRDRQALARDEVDRITTRLASLQ